MEYLLQIPSLMTSDVEILRQICRRILACTGQVDSAFSATLQKCVEEFVETQQQQQQQQAALNDQRKSAKQWVKARLNVGLTNAEADELLRRVKQQRQLSREQDE